MKSESIMFDINMCKHSESMSGDSNNGSKKECKNEEEIMEFTKDLVVQLWIINSKLDLRFTNE